MSKASDNLIYLIGLLLLLTMPHIIVFTLFFVYILNRLKINSFLITVLASATLFISILWDSSILIEALNEYGRMIRSNVSRLELDRLYQSNWNEHIFI